MVSTPQPRFTSSLNSGLIWSVISNDLNNQSICYNTSAGSMVESVSATGADGNFDIQWDSEGQGESPMPVGFNSPSYSSPSITDTTLYYAVYTSTYGCGDVTSNSILINVLPPASMPHATGLRKA